MKDVAKELVEVLEIYTKDQEGYAKASHEVSLVPVGTLQRTISVLRYYSKEVKVG